MLKGDPYGSFVLQLTVLLAATEFRLLRLGSAVDDGGDHFASRGGVRQAFGADLFRTVALARPRCFIAQRYLCSPDGELRVSIHM